MPLRVGIHPNNLHLSLLEHWPGAVLGDDVSFVPYSEGRDSAKLLRDGTIDVCGTGSTPPILAQAAGLDVLYIAASARRPSNSGLVVAPRSEIGGVADLRGRRVALIDGSFHTYLLARILEDHGMTLADVERVEMRPAASLRALATGDVAAWIAMTPLFDQAIASNAVRLLARCGDTIPNRSVFWTLRRRGFDDAVLDGVQAGLARLGDEIARDPDLAARRLGASNATDADLDAWRAAVRSRDWRIVAADLTVIGEQQEEAETLRRHGDLARPIDVRDAVRPKFAADLLSPLAPEGPRS